MSALEAVLSEVIDGKIYIFFDGRLDTAKTFQIQSQIISLADGAQHPLVFDLEKVDFVASAFLRLCIISARTVGADRFFLVNLNPTVSRVFSIAGLDKHLQIA